MKNKQLTTQLIKYLQNLESEKDILDFLMGILTPGELEQLPIRLEIIKQLKKGVPQHKIAQDLKIGIATVTRGSRAIQQGYFKEIKSDE